MNSSSESISLSFSLLTVVTGVGGAASDAEAAAEATLFLGKVSVVAEEIVASAAFRFRVVGGMVPV
jgi:hypothetical protein